MLEEDFVSGIMCGKDWQGRKRSVDSDANLQSSKALTCEQ